MKILNVLSGRERAGIKSYILNVSQELGKLEGVELSFVVLRDVPLIDELRDLGFKVTSIKKRHRFDILVSLRIARLVKADGIDIVHTHNVSGNFYGRLSKTFGSRARIVTTVHANVLEEHLSSRGRFSLARLLSFVDHKMAGYTDRFITISDYLRGVLLDAGKKPTKVITVHSGLSLDSAVLTKSEARARKEFDIKRGEKVIGTVARLVPLKNCRMFIEAAAELIEGDFFKVKFLIVGDGPQREKLESYVRNLGIEGSVLFLGWRKDLENIYPLMDLYVTCPTSEGLGLTPLEAMRFALPVVATRVGGLPEIVRDNDTGLLIESGNTKDLVLAIKTICTDKKLHKKFGVAGKKLLDDEFTVARMAEGIFNVYVGLLN